MRSDQIALVSVVIIALLYVGGVVGFWYQIESTKDPFVIEVSTNDESRLSEVVLNGLINTEIPFNITLLWKTFENWISARYKIFANGSYTQHKTERIYFTYASLTENNGISNITLSPKLYITITLK